MHNEATHKVPAGHPVPSGILLVDKPSGVSSAAVVARAKKALGATRVGHSGTLDPFATGLLVLLTERATRLASFAEAGQKTYEGILRFGIETDSHDITGNITRAITGNVPGAPEEEHVYKCAREFLGDILQIPPQISALKVSGKRAYALARSGVEVALEPRSVHIADFSLQRLSDFDYRYSIRCSRGTYVRALARDLGERIGIGACVVELRRTQSQPFSIDSACSIEELSAACIQPWENLFPDTLRLRMTSARVRELLSGNERALAACNSELRGTDAPIALYGDELSSVPAGLLYREGDAWRFGVNMECAHPVVEQ